MIPVPQQLPHEAASYSAAAAPLGCVICGYNEIDYQQYARGMKLTQRHSGAYHTVISNSVLYKGNRMPYMELLNEVLTQGTNSNARLHVCRLPNLGVAYLRNFLIKHDLEAQIVNFYSDEKELFERLLRSNPLTVAITTTFYTSLLPIQEIVEFVRCINPNVTIIVGGPYVYNLCEKGDPEEVDSALTRIGADVYVHDSQGERTLVNLIRAVRSGGALEDVPNIIFPVKAAAGTCNRTVTMGSKAMRRTPRVVENNDMDAYSVNWANFSREFFVPTVQLRTARSCAYKCAFCCYPIMAGPLSLTSLSVIESEMKYLQACGVRIIVFIDDTFNIPKGRFKDLCRMMIANRFGFSWFSYFRAGNADIESIDLAVESGCKGVFLGIESGDQGILNKMNKAAKVENLIGAVRELNARGVFTFASLIVGFPGETSDSVKNTVRFIEEAAPSGFRAELYFHSSITPVHNRAQQYELRGNGYAWEHSTMRWQEAVQEIHQIYASVTRSAIVAEHMFDFWSLPYLVGKGFQVSDYRNFIRAAHPFLLRSMSDQPFDASPYMENLRKELSRVRVQAS